MPCHGCATNFSLFVTELTCQNCKFSFCSKCLKGKVTTDEVSQKVCSDCHKKLTSNAPPSVQHFDPPALLLKRLENLENPAKPPITLFKQKGKLSYLKANLDPEDREIVERLEKLKEDRKMTSPPSESELKHRLMVLKGLKYESNNEKPQIIQSPAKSEQEQVDDLMKQYMNEMTLEGKMSEELHNSLEDMKDRIQKLHTSQYTGLQKNLTSTFESDEGDAISKKIIEKAIAEAKLEKKLKESGLMSDNDGDDDDDDDDDVYLDHDNGEEEVKIDVDFEATELPWCIICNADATLKCVGCDGSLYCNTCFKQGHEYFEMESHKTIKFK